MTNQNRQLKKQKNTTHNQEKSQQKHKLTQKQSMTELVTQGFKTAVINALSIPKEVKENINKRLINVTKKRLKREI